jgi:HPt (histidine-containing phosphotransfer) domain-containing protein
MLRAFLDVEAPQAMAALRQAMALSDFDAAAAAAHKLRGSCSVLGALPLAAVLSQLESQARSGALEGGDGHGLMLAVEQHAVRAFAALVECASEEQSQDPARSSQT